MRNLPASTDRRESNIVTAPKRGLSLCLIVHDDLELRLRLAGLVRRAMPKLDADCVTRSAFDAMTIERVSSYVAVLLIVEFSLPGSDVDPLTRLTYLRDRASRLPVFIFARNGDERSAARAVKLGAAEYWPIHSVNISELGCALQPLLEPAPNSEAATTKAGDRWRQPEIAGYRLTKKIAQSAAASVYLASNEDLAQPVALKVQIINGLQTVSEADRMGFTRECKILSTLNHRSIANVLDFGITDDYLYLALEYFPCGSLRDRLKNPLNEAEAVHYARQIGEALQVVHAAQIVHRDLKPSNIMLTSDNRVVLIDFGSARSHLVSSELSRTDMRTGTPYYVCPEQIEGNNPDARGDLYSLGVILFEMLAGTLPFNGDNLSDILAGHRLSAVPRLPEHLSHYQSIIDRLLAKNPNDRYSSAAIFLADLAKASADLNTSKRTKSQGALDS